MIGNFERKNVMGFLKFTEIKDTGKTKVFSVTNLSGDNLALVKWHAGWRKYTFQPVEYTIFDSSCLKEITEYIDKLMEDRKNGTNG